MISCIMPTYNRYPHLGYLVEEAVECFLRQDPTPGHERELVIVNDTPGQVLHCPAPGVKVLNVPTRFGTLSDKIQAGIEFASGDLLCRWDDDDIHMPHRLAYSLDKLGQRLEWRSANHWYENGSLHETVGPTGNSHVHALWRRAVLAEFPGGVYPAKLSGSEDQAFNQALAAAKVGMVERVPQEDIYYLYRWNTGSAHLSGRVDPSTPDNPHQAHWDARGHERVERGVYTVEPRWQRNYVAYVEQRLRKPVQLLNPLDITHYFNYVGFYDWLVDRSPRGAKLCEVGTLSGASTCYLANRARNTERRMHVYAVDIGIGVNEDGFKADFTDCPGLLTNIYRCGCTDMITPILQESTVAAHLFPDKSLDAVFIDAAHRRQAVRADLQAWVRKVKPGGIVSGHDYQGTGCPEVAPEVDAYFGAAPLSLASAHSPSVWVVQV